MADRPCSTGTSVPSYPERARGDSDYPASTLSVASAGAAEAVPRSSSAATGLTTFALTG